MIRAYLFEVLFFTFCDLSFYRSALQSFTAIIHCIHSIIHAFYFTSARLLPCVFVLIPLAIAC